MSRASRSRKKIDSNPFDIRSVARLSERALIGPERTVTKAELDAALADIREHVRATAGDHAGRTLEGGRWKLVELQHGIDVARSVDSCEVATDAEAELVRRGFRLALELVVYERNVIYDAQHSVRQSKFGSWVREMQLWERGLRAVLDQDPEATVQSIFDRIEADGHWTIDELDVELTTSGDSTLVVRDLDSDETWSQHKAKLRTYLSRAKQRNA